MFNNFVSSASHKNQDEFTFKWLYYNSPKLDTPQMPIKRKMIYSYNEVYSYNGIQYTN